MLLNRTRRFTTAALLTTLAALSGLPAAGQSLEFVANQNAISGVAEIVAYDKVSNRLFTTHGSGIDVYNFNSGSDFAPVGTIDLSGLFGGTLDSISSVAIDPLGRGFGVASAIPSANLTQQGRVVLFDTSTGTIFNQFTTGYHPDMVTFTPDGSQILIANEGEASTNPANPLDPAGGISVLNIGPAPLVDLIGLSSSAISEYNFAPANFVDPTDLEGLRVDPRNEFAVPLDLEPEYISVSGDKAYVSLQENSAIAVFDLATGQWSDIHNIYGKNQIVDASDKDGIAIDDELFGLYMPDAVATYDVAGKTYIVTANEGDARDGVIGEEKRVKDLYRKGDASAPSGAVFIDEAVFDDLNMQYGGDFQADTALGRIRVTTLDGDTDGDGDIDVLTMYGTRSFSIFDADTGSLVFDSGSDFETITSNLAPAYYNSEDGDTGEFDGRSDNKGPEPEGLAVANINGKTLAAIGLERTGGIMIYDITDPNNPVFLQYLNSLIDNGTASIGPEGLTWITPEDSPTGEAYLVVSYEGGTGAVDIFRVVPEPGSLALLGLGTLLIARRRRG